MDRKHLAQVGSKTHLLTKELSNHGLILQPLADHKDNDKLIQTN